MFAADDFLLLGLHWIGEENMRGPHEVIRAGTSQFDTYMTDSFEKLWEKATPATAYTWWTCEPLISAA